MKNLLTAFLPAFALLALGGCASTTGITSSEDDGVYYSSKDRTTAVAPPVVAAPAPAAASGNEAVNPDYTGTAPAASSRSSASNTPQYYDDSYSYSRSRVYYSPGVAYYAPVVYAPYTTLSYANCGWGGGFCGYSPYGYSTVWADPFYNPYYSPYYGYGSSVTISVGFGQPWGYGYGGYGYGRPYGYGGGYGGFYDPYYYGGRYYGGYYGNNYYGGGGYYGNNRNVIYTGGGNDRNGRTVMVGPRRSRGGDVVTGGRSGSTGAGSAPTGGGRSVTGGRAAGTSAPNMPTGGRSTGGRPAGSAQASPYSEAILSENGSGRGRGRVIDGGQINGSEVDAPVTSGGRQGRVSGRTETTPNVQPTYVDNMNTAPGNTPRNMPRSGGWRTVDGGGRVMEQPGQVVEQPVANPQPENVPQPYNRRTRRGDLNPGTESDGQVSQPQRTEGRSRSYEQPTYSPPARSSQPSFEGGGGRSGGSSDGGGNSGGGGGRRGR